jgi:hypothetical protein
LVDFGGDIGVNEVHKIVEILQRIGDFTKCRHLVAALQNNLQ